MVRVFGDLTNITNLLLALLHSKRPLRNSCALPDNTDAAPMCQSYACLHISCLSIFPGTVAKTVVRVKYFVCSLSCDYILSATHGCPADAYIYSYGFLLKYVS